MALFHLPPATQVPMLSRCLVTKPSHHAALGRTAQNSALDALRRRCVRTQWRRYTTVDVGDHDKGSGAGHAHDLPPLAESGTRDLRWAEIMPAARKAVEERSRAAAHEKAAVLHHVKQRLARKPPGSRMRKSLLARFNRALGKSDPLPALYDAVAGSLRTEQDGSADGPPATKAASTRTTPGRTPSASADGAAAHAPTSRAPNSAFQVHHVTYGDVKANMQMPTASDYPDAARSFRNALDTLDTSSLRTVFEGIGSQSNPPISIVASREPLRQAAGYVYDLKFDPDGRFQQHVIGTGQNKSQAMSAAWLALASLLHASGALAELLPKAHFEAIQPRKEQYPSAPDRLFDPDHIVTEMNNVFQLRRLSPVTSGEYQAQGHGLGTFTLRLDIPGIADVTATGRAESRTLAKRAAWVAMLNRLHTHGALQRLFPTARKSDRNDNSDNQIFIRDEPAPAIELVEVDPNMLRQEKDARLDIYNYAAKYGIVPQFKAEFVRHVTRRSRRAQATKIKVVQASIKLPEHGIEVVTRGKDLRTAEVAAALAFKRQAEEQHTSGTQGHDRTPAPAYELLNTDTAEEFVRYFRSRHPGMTLEVESDTVQVAGNGANFVRILLDAESRGEPGIMRSKKDAVAVAYLLTAMSIAESNIHILEQWTERKKSGEIPPERAMRPIRTDVETEVLDLMRDTLVSARKAGLPDQRETLGAEEEVLEFDQTRRRFPSSHERDRASQNHQKTLEQFQKNPRLEALRTAKATLPMSQYTKQVADLVSGDVYSIIIGATGSGKTTQVPQILLDQAIEAGNGGYCDIICTQPRRLAASSVAQRVAAERDEQIGHSVGYQVRGDVRLPLAGGSITYCTTGILLEQLKWSADEIMDNVSHLVIDEVHERDIFLDFLLIILKKAVEARQQAGKKVPHIVLMSATLDKKLFSEYLPNTKDGKSIPCPSLSVPGRTFPVAEKYLVELVQEISSLHTAEFDDLMREDKGISKDYLDAELNFARNTTVSAPVIDWKRKYSTETDPESQDTATQKTESLVPVHLVTATLAHICNKSDEGAILAFLPGLQEITAAQKFLLKRPIFGVDFADSTKFKILPLHSTVPPDEQKLIFDPSPPGCRKIILTTNIAETSVTVPDVKFVVDAGKLREKRYDQVKRISELQTVWESDSNARQRAGRAGRVSNGNYYALYSRQRRQAMSASGQPELLRSDLQETCLSIKAQGFQKPVASFLADAIEPPPSKAVNVAVENLKSIEAFTDNEKLTSLGRILSRLPVHPSLGNMILLGIVFRCLDPMIISSCQASERSLFVDPPGARTIARQQHRVYAQDGSDHLAFINAFKDLRRQMYGSNTSRAFAYAQDRFLHFGAFKTMEQTTRSIAQALYQAKLISDVHPDFSNGYMLGGPELNVNSGNTALIKSLTLAGVYPNIAVRRALATSPIHRTCSEDKVMMHPSSINAASGRQRALETDHIYAFSTLARNVAGDMLYMRETTVITPLMAMLFGGRLETKSHRHLTMDKWLPFSINALNSDFALRLILEFRKAKDRMLYGAYKDLIGGQKGLLHNPARQIFASGLANLLKVATRSNRLSNDWIPESFRRPDRGREQARSEGFRFMAGSDDVRNQNRGEDRRSARFT